MLRAFGPPSAAPADLRSGDGTRSPAVPEGPHNVRLPAIRFLKQRLRVGRSIGCEQWIWEPGTRSRGFAAGIHADRGPGQRADHDADRDRCRRRADHEHRHHLQPDQSLRGRDARRAGSGTAEGTVGRAARQPEPDLQRQRRRNGVHDQLAGLVPEHQQRPELLDVRRGLGHLLQDDLNGHEHELVGHDQDDGDRRERDLPRRRRKSSGPVPRSDRVSALRRGAVGHRPRVGLAAPATRPDA